MDFETIKRCIKALNSTSPIKIGIELAEDVGCEMYSSKAERTIIYGPYVEVLYYLYCCATQKVFINYLCQSIYSRHSMYKEALITVNKLNAILRPIFTKIVVKMRYWAKRERLSDLTMLSIFHEIGHIVFSVDESVKLSYFNEIINQVSSINTSPALSNIEDDFLLNQTQLGIQMALDNKFNTAEEIACDCYAIDLIFKLRETLGFSSFKVLNYCLAAIDLLNCMYQVEFLNRTSNSDDESIFCEVLAKFGIRRMIIFSRMVDVLSSEYGIDMNYFDKLCKKIGHSITDICELRELAGEMSSKIKQRNWRVKDMRQKEYSKLIDDFNAKYTSAYCNF